MGQQQSLTVNVKKIKGKNKDLLLQQYRSSLANVLRPEHLGGGMLLNSYRCLIEREGEVVVKQYVKEGKAMIFREYEQQLHRLFFSCPLLNARGRSSSGFSYNSTSECAALCGLL